MLMPCKYAGLSNVVKVRISNAFWKHSVCMYYYICIYHIYDDYVIRCHITSWHFQLKFCMLVIAND